jgi:hypothetical protein
VCLGGSIGVSLRHLDCALFQANGRHTVPSGGLASVRLRRIDPPHDSSRGVVP